MGQNEIYQYLKQQKQSGNRKFLSIRQISKALDNENNNKVSRACQRLYAWGYLDIETKKQIKGRPWHGWRKKYRLK